MVKVSKGGGNIRRALCFVLTMLFFVLYRHIFQKVGVKQYSGCSTAKQIWGSSVRRTQGSGTKDGALDCPRFVTLQCPLRGMVCTRKGNHANAVGVETLFRCSNVFIPLIEYCKLNIYIHSHSLQVVPTLFDMGGTSGGRQWMGRRTCGV